MTSVVTERKREPAPVQTLDGGEAHSPVGDGSESERLRREQAAEVMKRGRPAAPDRGTPRVAAVPPAPVAVNGLENAANTVSGERLERELVAMARPEAQWPELRLGQGVLVERRDRDGQGYSREILELTRITGEQLELTSRSYGTTLRVDRDVLRSRVAWQYGHPVNAAVVEHGLDVTWSLKAEANLTASEPPAVATETMRALLRKGAETFDATLRAAMADPAQRDRWERVMTLQGRYRDLTHQRRELEQGLAAHLKVKPLRISALIADLDPVESAYRAQLAALDAQLIDVGAASAHVAGGAGLAKLAGKSSDPLVLSLAREELGEHVSAATLLGIYLDNAEAALARGSVSGALIANAAALQPYLEMSSGARGSMHRLPGETGVAGRPSLTMALNQLIAEGVLGKRELVHSSAQLAAVAIRLSETQLATLKRRHDSLQATEPSVSVNPNTLSLAQRGRRQNRARDEVTAALTREVERLRAVETSEPHLAFLESGGRAALARADELTRRTASAATADELLKFGRGVADVFDSVNTWVMAGAAMATRGIGAATFARGMPQLGELLLAYRSGRLSTAAARSAAFKTLPATVGNAVTFTSLNNLALDAIGQERFADWSPAAFTTNLLASTMFDVVRARSFLRNIESAPAVQGSLGLRLHNGRLIAQQAAEQVAGMSAVGIGAAYLRTGDFAAAEQVVTANLQFLVAMGAVGKLGGNKVVVPEAVVRVERHLRDYRQLPATAVKERRETMEKALAALDSVSDKAMPGRAAQLAAEVIAQSRAPMRPPHADNVPTAFADATRGLIEPLMRPKPFKAPTTSVTTPGKDYAAVFPAHPLDGDSVMSAIATVRALRGMGVEAYMAMSQPLPRNLRDHAPRPHEVLENAQTIFPTHPPRFAIGVDSVYFFGRAAEALPQGTPMLRIDHHKADLPPWSNTGPMSASWVDPKAQSSGQMVGDLVAHLGQVYAGKFNVPPKSVGLQGRGARDIIEPLLVAAYTDVWGGAARPLANANEATLGFFRALSPRVDATAAFTKLGGQIPLEVRRALANNYGSHNFYGGGRGRGGPTRLFDHGPGAPRSATELKYDFTSSLALLERLEGKRAGLDHHRDLKGFLLDRLDGHAQHSDVIIAMIPEANLAGIAGTRFFLRSYAHSDAMEMTDAVKSAAVRRFPERASLIDAGSKPQVGGGWMPLAEAELREVMHSAIANVLAAKERP
ncbi:MAG: hypothetical protein ACAI38_17545 [Myxococcota bacterium]